MVKEPLYLPGDKQELFDRYLDKTAHADLIERLRVTAGNAGAKGSPSKQTYTAETPTTPYRSYRRNNLVPRATKAHKENVSSSSDRFCRACLYEPD